MIVSLPADRGVFVTSGRTPLVQIVGYDRTPRPAMYLADDGAVTRVELAPGTTIEYALADRHCAGTIETDRHRSCDQPATPWCATHTETWICARCRGTCLKDTMDCHDRHVVYLAIVAPDAVKVGVTRAERIETRLHEQGADRGAIIHTVPNGRIARELEHDISETLPDRIEIDTKVRGLARTVDEDVWANVLAEYDPIQCLEPEYDCTIETQPIPEVRASGRVIGTKGRLLILAVNGTTYVTDLRDLIGYRVQPGADPRHRQTGLAAYS